MEDLLLQASRIDILHTQSLEKHRESLEELTRQVSPTIKDIRNTQEETNALLDALLQAVPQLSLRSPTPIEEIEDPMGNNRLRGEKTAIQDTSIHLSVPVTAEKRHSHPPVAIPVRSLTGIGSGCASDCACACHRRQNMRTPPILKKLAGSLMLGYNGSLILQQRCTVPTCRKRSDKSPQLSYYFPSWFVQRAVTLSFTSTAFGTPNLNLKVRRVVSETSELFRLSRFGDVGGVQELFSAQEASPDDVNPIGGWTAFHVSMRLFKDHLHRLRYCSRENGADLSPSLLSITAA